MDAQTLVNCINNEKSLHESARHAVKMLRHVVDRAARMVAKSNAEWHDDPEADDHADFHAPADAQFPRNVRDAAMRELADYWTAELTLDESNRAEVDAATN